MKDQQLIPPVKGKKMDNLTLSQTLQTRFKAWGTSGQRYMRAALL